MTSGTVYNKQDPAASCTTVYGTREATRTDQNNKCVAIVPVVKQEYNKWAHQHRRGSNHWPEELTDQFQMDFYRDGTGTYYTELALPV